MNQIKIKHKAKELNIEDLLQKAIALHKEGNTRDAKNNYLSVLKLHSSNPIANFRLGQIADLENKSKQAIKYYKKSVETNPKIEQFWLSYIGALIKEKKFEEANLAIEKAKREVIVINRLKPSIKFTLAKDHNDINNISNPSNEELNILLKYYQNGQYNDAHDLGLLITQKFPNNQFGWKILGSTLRLLGRINEALVANENSIKLAPEDPEAHNNLGNNLKDLEKLDEATFHYKKAIELKPDYSSAYLNLFDILDKTNRSEEILLIIKKIKGKTYQKLDDILFYELLATFRQGDHITSIKLITKINFDKLSENIKTDFLHIKGKVHHNNKDFDIAYESFNIMNSLIKQSDEYKIQKPNKYFVEKTKIVDQLIKLQQKTKFKPFVEVEKFQPNFMVGFPRSGTTLLDTILRTHSKINVIEEKPMLSRLEKNIDFCSNISELEKISYTQAESARSFYINELKKYVELNENKIVIDKLPLNILRIPLINKIFPKSKFIIALRHPFDCILSCWMQNFRLNSGMANMVDLDRIADLYCISMEILKLSQERYKLNTHRIRYEDLVSDYKESTSNVLAFLDLKWEDKLLNYQNTAISRKIINTPSHTEVIKPIYKTAISRWKNYEKYLNPLKDKLQPWLEYYDYLDQT